LDEVIPPRVGTFKGSCPGEIPNERGIETSLEFLIVKEETLFLLGIKSGFLGLQ
jgi:hypothetical protein